MSWRLLRAAPLVLATLAGRVGAQDQVPSDVTFNLRRIFLQELLTSGPGGRSVGARWQTRLRIGEHSDVHDVGADCEIHIGAKLPNNRVIATPRGIVVEPPNVCRLRVPQIEQAGSIRAAWAEYFDAVFDQMCDVTGFPRIFAEHSSGGGGGSNPDHVVEIHPATAIACDGETVNLLPLLQVFAGMRKISPASAAACLDQRRLFVRQRGGDGDGARYEFAEQGAKGPGGSCGNFAVVDAHVNKEYLRALSNGGDHVALARVWVGDNGPYALKLYTYRGTAEDNLIAALMANPDENAELELQLHGLLTYDYFTIVQVLQDENFNWLPASQLRDYREVRGPLALIVFGRAQP